MGTLSASLNIAVSSMLAEQGAVATTTNNIANANTPGYSRQVANLEEAGVLHVGQLTFGTGVRLASVSSLRDSVLDLRVNQETQQQGQLQGFLQAGNQLQVLFNEASSTGLQSPLSAFFNSFSQLSASPSNLTARQNVITSAQNLASAFNQTSNNLSTLRQNTDVAVQQSVSQINSFIAQIATANQQVQAASFSGQNPGPFVDQRQQLMSQLSNYIGFSEIDAGDGTLTLTAANGSALVAGGLSFALTTQTNPSTNCQDIYSNGLDITSQITGGQLAGQIQIRDQEIPSLQTSLDALAYNLESTVNTQHKAGFDLNGDAGANLFTPLTQQQGAAANISVTITDPAKIAASGTAGTGNAGDNTNANALLALQNQNIVDEQSPLGFYSNLVFRIGNDVSTAQTNETAGTQVLQQLQNLQGGASNVGINEEAANLVRFQNAYESSAQVVSVINSLLQTTINMVS